MNLTLADQLRQRALACDQMARVALGAGDSEAAHDLYKHAYDLMRQAINALPPDDSSSLVFYCHQAAAFAQRGGLREEAAYMLHKGLDAHASAWTTHLWDRR